MTQELKIMAHYIEANLIKKLQISKTVH